MKKNIKSGFVLAETIIISVVVMISLVGIYVQFVTVSKSFYTSFKYNSVNNLYLANNIKQYIKKENFDNFKILLANNDYLELTDCSSSLFNEYAYCETLFNSVGAKRIIMTHKNLENLKNKLGDTNFNEYLKQFIKSLKTNDLEGYRLIVEFDDNEFVTLDIN